MLIYSIFDDQGVIVRINKTFPFLLLGPRNFMSIFFTQHFFAELN